MADDGKWELSREEIEERIRKSNQEWKRKGLTRGGRSSGQGVKLLYIRDFLYAHATKEHPQNANRIQEFLASKGIEASVKAIYNDILRLQKPLKTIGFQGFCGDYGTRSAFLPSAKIMVATSF